MDLIKANEGTARQPAPGAPTATPIFGGVEGGPDVGLVRVKVPAGAGMPAHRHSGSDIILTTITGMVRISIGDESVEVHPGDSVLITKDEAVSLANPGTSAAEVLVAAGPAHFIETVRAWPEPTAN
ncbi:MAG: cupin domain-containing protein [Micrococcaceae bacterium]|uniref:cupin domain-containing protein n=1 Tax=Yaniella sp. TaxID=2773929 RepID=UPI00264A203A